MFLRALLMVTLCLLPMATVQSDDKGLERVTVIKPRVELRIGDKIVGAAEFGDSFDVARVDGELVWISGRTASLPRADLIPYDRAVERYTAALEQAASADNYQARGTIWLKRGEHRIAAGDFTAALEQQLTDSKARAKLFILRGIAWRSAADRARDDVLREFAGSSGFEQDQRRDAALRVAGEREWERSLADCDEAIRLNPLDPVAYMERGTHWHLRRPQAYHDRAIADFSEAIRLDPQYARAYAGRSLAFGQRGESRKATDDLTEAIRIQPDNPTLYHWRAGKAMGRGESERAMADINAALKIDPQYVEALVVRGGWHRQKNEIDQYLADSWKAARLDPVRQAFTGLECCLYWYDKGEAEQVVTYLEEYLRLQAKSPRAAAKTPLPSRARLMLAWIRSTCPDEKYRDGKLAREHFSNAEQSHAYLGESDKFRSVEAAVHAELGEFPAALECQKRVTESANRIARNGPRPRPAGFGPDPMPAPMPAAQPYKSFDMGSEACEARLRDYMTNTPHRDKEWTLP